MTGRRLGFRIGTLLVVAAASVLVAFAVRAAHSSTQNRSGLHAIHVVDVHRRTVWACQEELHQKRSPTRFLERRTRRAGVRWTWATFWGRREQLVCSTVHVLNSHPWLAVRYAFDRVHQGEKAVAVSGCETGWTYWIGASNGKHLGLMQMGEQERRTCGHGMTALRQAFAALCWWRRAGGWDRWSCA